MFINIMIKTNDVQNSILTDGDRLLRLRNIDESEWPLRLEADTNILTLHFTQSLYFTNSYSQLHKLNHQQPQAAQHWTNVS